MEGRWHSDGLDAEGTASWSVDREGGGAGDTTTTRYDEIYLHTDYGNPMNLLFTPSSAYSTPLSKYYFQIDILSVDRDSSSLSVGVVRPSEFRKGYMNKGMFYNGNLTNCGGALILSYGPRPKQGDTIVVEYTELTDSFQVCFHVNGKLLGIAFQIPKWSTISREAASESFLPCLHGEGEFKLKVSTSVEMPVITAANSITHPLVGDWLLLEAFADEANQEKIWPPLPSRVGTDNEHYRMTLHMEPKDDEWKLSLKVCNTLMAQKLISELEGEDEDEVDQKQYRISGPIRVVSTMMRPRPPLDAIEPKLSNALGSGWKTFSLDRSGTLFAQSRNGSILAAFQRIEIDLDAVACVSY
jgi:hypothetical protein